MEFTFGISHTTASPTKNNASNITNGPITAVPPSIINTASQNLGLINILNIVTFFLEIRDYSPFATATGTVGVR